MQDQKKIIKQESDHTHEERLLQLDPQSARATALQLINEIGHITFSDSLQDSESSLFMFVRCK